MSLATGTVLGPYEIVEKVGQGGMATVYKAYHKRLDRFVALKVLHPGHNEDTNFLNRFDREARVVARLEHPHIVPIYDFADQDGAPYLVMRYIDGQTLKRRLGDGSLTGPEIARLTQAIASGLDYAHQQDVLHRDIKPSNILLSDSGNPYVADFGLARLLQAGESTMSQDMIMGTPHYISPEQAKGAQAIDGRADQYSLGIVVFEMITGQVPFQSDTSYAIIHAQIFDPPPLPSSLNPQLTPDVDAVLTRALSKEPGDRYPNVTAFAAALATVLSELPAALVDPGGGLAAPASLPSSTLPPLPDLETAPASDVTPVVEPTPTGKRRHRWLITGLLLLGAILGLLFLRGRARNQPLNAASPVVPTSLAATPARQLVGTAVPRDAVSDRPPPALQSDLLENPREIDRLQQLIAAAPDDISLQIELAAAYAAADQPEQGEAIMREALQSVRAPSAFVTLGTRLLSSERYVPALIVLEEGQAQYPNFKELQQLLMMTYIITQQPADVVAAFLEEVSTANEKSVTVALGEAYLAAAAGQETRAAELLTEAQAKASPEAAAELLFLQGMLLRELDETSRARATFSEAQRLNPPPWLASLIERNIVELSEE